MPETRQALRQCSEHAGRIGFFGSGATKHGTRPRVPQDRLGFSGAVRRMQRREDAAEARDGIINDDEFRRARQLDGNHVATPQAKRGERGSETFGAVERGGIADRRKTGRGDRRRFRCFARPMLQPCRGRFGRPAAGLHFAPHVVRSKAHGVANGHRVRAELGLVEGVVLHPSLGTKTPAAAQLEQAIIAFGLESPLLQQHPDEGHLLCGKPQPGGNLSVRQTGARALPLDLLEVQQPNRIAAAVLNVGAEIKNDRTERVDHLRRNAEPLTSRWRRHSALSATARRVARRLV